MDLNWKPHFKKSAEHHDKMHEEHAATADEHHAVAAHHKAEGNHELHKHHTAIATRHENLANHHAKRGKHYESLHTEATTKAMEDELAKNRRETQPTSVSGVTPTVPAGLRAIPRPGAAQPATAAPNVPMEFMKLVSVEDGEEAPSAL